MLHLKCSFSNIFLFIDRLQWTENVSWLLDAITIESDKIILHFCRRNYAPSQNNNVIQRFASFSVENSFSFSIVSRYYERENNAVIEQIQKYAVNILVQIQIDTLQTLKILYYLVLISKKICLHVNQKRLSHTQFALNYKPSNLQSQLK